MSFNGSNISPQLWRDHYNTNKKKYNFLVFIGRFQPLHLGHCRVIDHALSLAETVLVFVGSTNSVRSFRNPFTFEERKEMIENHYKSSNVKVLPLDDFTYNDEGWITQVQKQVRQAVVESIPGNTKGITLHGLNDVKVGLIGCEKDHTSYYLNMFPDWGNEKVNFLNPLNATDIRLEYFLNNPYSKDTTKNHLFMARKVVPSTVLNFLDDFSYSKEYNDLTSEYKFVEKYKKSWENAPYEPIFVTVDGVVIQSGHILLVRRKAMPGEGLLALPGGFVNPEEKLLDSVIRELREETKIKVPEPVLRGSIKSQKVFDEPHRSSRGRTITHAFLIHLKPGPLPKVKGGDDARSAFWVPLGELDPKEMFEDHWHIIQNMTGEL